MRKKQMVGPPPQQATPAAGDASEADPPAEHAPEPSRDPGGG